MHRPRWQCSCRDSGGVMVQQFCIDDPCVDWLSYEQAEQSYVSGDIVVRRWPEYGSWNYDIMAWHEKSFAVWGFDSKSQFLKVAGDC